MSTSISVRRLSAIAAFTFIAQGAYAQADQKACASLMTSFIGNEVNATMSHRFNERRREIASDYAKMAPTSAARLDIQIASEKTASDDRRDREKGDSIIQLMAAQKCEMPDHVTSPYTYKADFDLCDRTPASSPDHGRLCSIHEIAWDRWKARSRQGPASAGQTMTK